MDLYSTLITHEYWTWNILYRACIKSSLSKLTRIIEYESFVHHRNTY